MRRKGSYAAAEIDNEYRRRKAFAKKQRANCKEKNCDNCVYVRICTESESNYEIQNE